MADPHNPFTSSPSPHNPYAAPPPPPAAPGGAQFNPYAAPSAGYGYHASPVMNPGYDMLASRGSRFLGSLLDGLIYAVFMLPPLFIFAAAMDSEEAAIIGMLIGLAIVAGIQWYLIATTGQSIAKRLLGMKIVKMDGSDVNFVSGVIMRSWVVSLMGAIPFVGNFVGLVDALMIFGQEQRCLHDYIAGTKVISV